MGFGRLKQGKSLFEVFCFLVEEHPKGLKRSDIQTKLKMVLGVGESVGGVNRHLKKLRNAALIEWSQKTYTYKLASDFDSKDFFIRVVDTFRLTTDKAFFMSIKMVNILSKQTLIEVDDYIGHKYDEEMSENISKLEDNYKINEIHVHDDIKKLLRHHSSYVRLRLFKTTNECFI
ncbi:MAG: hypothetical protein KKD39_01195, partial [Candidatus Altiarchaeota archaeon]|nr:hypothetical protein [Candidatus Altiarchaeota archaeon]